MIYTLRQQRTLARKVQLEGFGFWSGNDVQVEFRPAEEHTGIVFVRADLNPPQRIPATIEHRTETPRRTTLAAGGACVEMVEHVLAALVGMRVDNCEIWVNNVEMPGCDGSSKAFVEAIQQAGTVQQYATKPRLLVIEPIHVGDDDAWVEVEPSDSHWSVKYQLDYGEFTPIGRQTLQLDMTPDSFARDLAPARTFLLKQEAEWLRQQGLGQRTTFKDVLVFDDHGPIENELRFEDECVRHKTLDLVGDLALAGCDLVGSFVAHRSGHRLNGELVKALLREGQILDQLRRSA